jgi:hypothetical protein
MRLGAEEVAAEFQLLHEGTKEGLKQRLAGYEAVPTVIRLQCWTRLVFFRGLTIS